MNPKNSRGLWAKILVVLGGIAMLAGAVDPLEGAVLILPGSGLVVLGTFLGDNERGLVIYSALVFVLIAIGTAAMWVLSSMGGFGGDSGRSMWWGLLLLPYPIGWSMGIWRPGSPRWMLWPGIGVGLWYLTIFGIILRSGGLLRGNPSNMVAPLVIASIGILTIGGCISRLRHRVN
ncbi:MAG: hypothetical protein ACLQSR_08615 [Limisphaerales bacterium]